MDGSKTHGTLLDLNGCGSEPHAPFSGASRESFSDQSRSFAALEATTRWSPPLLLLFQQLVALLVMRMRPLLLLMRMVGWRRVMGSLAASFESCSNDL